MQNNGTCIEVEGKGHCTTDDARRQESSNELQTIMKYKQTSGVKRLLGTKVKNIARR